MIEEKIIKDENGRIKKIERTDGTITIYRWHRNGEKRCEYNWKNREREGKQYWWYENGQKELEENWKNGKREGKQHEWYENGQKWSEENWKKGKEEGKQYEWYENGQKKYELNCIDGEKNGKQYWWYENGEKKYELNCIDGEKNGKQYWWHENGQKWREENWKKGKEEGKQYEWYENGEKKYELNYIDGEEKTGTFEKWRKKEEKFKKWLCENDVTEHMRLDDTTFHNYLVWDGEDFFVVTETNGTTTQGVEYIHKFRDGQDIANMDSTDYEGIFLTRGSLEEAGISEEKIQKILGDDDEIAFDDFGCDTDFSKFLSKLNFLSEEERKAIYDYSERRVLAKFLEDEEIEELREEFQRSEME